MPKFCRTLFLLVAFIAAAFPAIAGEISLEDWAFNIDGQVSEAFNGDDLPADGSLLEGVGAFSLNVSGEGSHSIIGFFDFEMFERNNTFFNESASVHGVAAAGQSWEVDEPGYVFGNIYDNVLDGSLQNDNGVPAGLEDDVSFAIGWNFNLLAMQTATISFVFTDVLPLADFYIKQFDPDLDESLYFYSTLTIEGGAVSVSEPSSMSLLIMMLGMLLMGKYIAGRFLHGR